MNLLKSGTLALLSAFVVAGCASTNEMLSDVGLSTIEPPTLPTVANLEEAGEAVLASVPSGLAGQSGLAAAPAGFSDAPPAAKPGECYARLTQPATFRTVTEEVLEKPESEKLVTIPATYRTVTEDVVIQEASERLVVVPATYKTVSETVVVEPERERIVTIPAQYETKTERVKIADAYTTWKKGVNPIAFQGGPEGSLVATSTTETGEIMCLVEVPAKYETRTSQILVTPATTRTEIVPAKTKTITRRVVDQPATTRVETVPAKVETVSRRIVETEERVETQTIPATYKTVTRQVLEQPARTAWTAVLCETNATAETIRSLQTALKARGHYTGAIDGIYGPLTARAVRRFQGTDGIVTMDSLRELGVAI